MAAMRGTCIIAVCVNRLPVGSYLVVELTANEVSLPPPAMSTRPSAIFVAVTNPPDWVSVRLKTPVLGS